MIWGYDEEWRKRLNRMISGIHRGSKKRVDRFGLLDEMRNEAEAQIITMMAEERVYDPPLALRAIKCNLIDIFFRSRTYNYSYGDTISHISYEYLMIQYLIGNDVEGGDIETELVADSPEDEWIEGVALEEAIKNCLDSRERKIVGLYLDGYNQREIASFLPIGGSIISKCLTAIREKLREEIGYVI